MGGAFGAAGSCTNGREMQLVFVLHHYLHHHLLHHQLLVAAATFTDCNENHPHRTAMETAHHATACPNGLTVSSYRRYQLNCFVGVF